MTRDQKIQELREKIRNWDVPRLGFAGRRRLEFILNDLLNNSN
jgi:hypothetical protein